MSGLTREQAERKALALGAKLEIGGKVFNDAGAKVAVSAPKKPEPAAPEPLKEDPLPGLLAQLNDTLSQLAAVRSQQPDNQALARTIADAVAAAIPAPAPVAAPRAAPSYDFEVVKRDERGYIQKAKLTPR